MSAALLLATAVSAGCGTTADPCNASEALPVPLSAANANALEAVMQRVTDDAAADNKLGVTFVDVDETRGVVTIGVLRAPTPELCRQLHERYGGIVHVVEHPAAGT